jgi:hypothetical protein
VPEEFPAEEFVYIPEKPASRRPLLLGLLSLLLVLALVLCGGGMALLFWWGRQ